MSTSSSKHSTGPAWKRPLAWLIVLAGLPVFILLAAAWAQLWLWLNAKISPHLSGFWADLVDTVVDDLQITAIATALVSYLGGSLFAQLAEKVIYTRSGWRYFVIAGLSMILAVYIPASILTERFPFPLPFQPSVALLLNLFLALGCYGINLILGVFRMRKERERMTRPPEPIWVFCYTGKPLPPAVSWSKPFKIGITPFCCVLGGPMLVNEHGTLEVPGRNGGKLDLALFFKIKEYIYREERVPSKTDWEAIYVFNGFLYDYDRKVICPDLIQVFPDNEKWNYADLLTSALYDKHPAEFRLGPDEDDFFSKWGDLQNCTKYRMDGSGNLSPMYSKTPRQMWEEKESKRLQEEAARQTTAAAPAAKPTATAAKPSAPTAKPAAPTVKPSAPTVKPAATAAKPAAQSREKLSLSPAERKAAIDYIYAQSFSVIWEAIDRAAPEIKNIRDIRTSSDGVISALADTIRQSSGKEDAPKSTVKQAKQTTAPAKPQTPVAGNPAPVKAAPAPAPESRKKGLVHIVFDSSLSPAQQDCVSRAVADTRAVFPDFSLEITGDGKNPRAEGIRKNMDSYSEGTQQKSGSYDASVILQRLKSLAQYKKDARAILLFTGRDLCLSSQKLSWCFGAANHSAHTAVCSVYRYESLSPQERLRCVRRTLRHEIGHALGMAADPKRANTEAFFGPHCVCPGCSMRQAGTLEKLLAFSLEEERRGSWFCPDCMAELRRASEENK